MPPMLSRFLNGWLTHGTTIESADPSSTADEFLDLHDAAEETINQVLYVAAQSKFSHEVSHLTALHDWLITAGLMVGNTQKKPPPAPKKVTKDNQPVKIIHGSKLITITPAMLVEARLDPSKYPGCVESGGQKCITCGSSGPHGQALTSRPVPPNEDRLYLEDCKCPLHGGDDEVANRRLALNPDILKVIASAIKAASGHDVDCLLQPEIKRLEHTIHWALKHLHSIASDEESEFAPSFNLFSKKFKETMDTIHRED
ncbi:hypothetical protein B0H10DRAFT_1953220 [Mycena sp. CBHHK59/15]|nr:hypothetical protein B0H10DRAFT_1953220 [Mycena sp. CBHHK59/15]